MTRFYSRTNRVLPKLFDVLLMILFFPALFNKKKEQIFPKNILLIELWGIGDLVMMASVLRPLRESFPEAEISLLTKEYAKEIFKASPVPMRYFTFDFPWTKFKGKYKLWNWDWRGIVDIIRRLRKEKFDLVIDARGDVRNNILSMLTNAKRRVGYGWTGGGFLLTDRGQNEKRKAHRVEAWQALLSLLGIESGRIIPSLNVDPTANENADRFLNENGLSGKRVIGIHPGARMPVRRWPLERFMEVAKRIEANFGYRIIFFRDPDMRDRECGGYPRFEGGLQDMMAVIKKLKLFICNDTGVMHIAAALGIPVIAVFGPGEKETIGPYGPEHVIVRKESVKCRPCWDYCRYKLPHCILDISADQVMQKVEEKLRE